MEKSPVYYSPQAFDGGKTCVSIRIFILYQVSERGNSRSAFHCAERQHKRIASGGIGLSRERLQEGVYRPGSPSDPGEYSRAVFARIRGVASKHAYSIRDRRSSLGDQAPGCVRGVERQGLRPGQRYFGL